MKELYLLNSCISDLIKNFKEEKELISDLRNTLKKHKERVVKILRATGRV